MQRMPQLEVHLAKIINVYIPLISNIVQIYIVLYLILTFYQAVYSSYSTSKLLLAEVS